MELLTAKLDEKCARAKTLAEVIDEKLLRLYPEEWQTKPLEDVLNLTAILIEQLDDIRTDADRLERETMKTA